MSAKKNFLPIANRKYPKEEASLLKKNMEFDKTSTLPIMHHPGE